MARARRNQNNLTITAAVESSEASTRIRNLETQLKRLQRSNTQATNSGRTRFRQLQQNLTGAERAASSLRATLVGAFSVATLAAFARGINNTVRDLVALDDTAKSIGLTFEQLQGLQILGRDFGANAENVTDVTRQIATNLARARDEGAGVAEELERAGFVFQNTAFGNLEELNRIFDNLSEATQISLTGESGNFIRQLLRDTEDLNAELVRLRDEGRITSESVLGDARQARERLDAAQDQLSTAFTELAIASTPLIEIFTDMVGVLAGVISTVQRQNLTDQRVQQIADEFPDIIALFQRRLGEARAVQDDLGMDVETLLDPSQFGQAAGAEMAQPVAISIREAVEAALESGAIANARASRASEGGPLNVTIPSGRAPGRSLPPLLDNATRDLMREEEEFIDRRAAVLRDHYDEILDEMEAQGMARIEAEERNTQLLANAHMERQELIQEEQDRLKELRAQQAEDLERELEEQARIWNAFVFDLEGSFNTFFRDIFRGTESFGDSLTNLFINILADIQAQLLQQLVAKPITNAIAGFIGNLVGGSLTTGFVPRQFGGPVTRNRPFLVGEAGPELFVPDTSGNIIPNNRLGAPISVVQNYSFAISTPDQIRAIALQTFPTLLAQTKSELAGAIARGESL